MTGYTIEAGYCSGYGLNGDPWEIILEAAKSISQEELLAEYQGPSECEKGCCKSDVMAESMTTRQGEDGSIIFHEDYIHMMASGGDVTRIMKESMRRAFARCVMRRADILGVDVDVTAR